MYVWLVWWILALRSVVVSVRVDWEPEGVVIERECGGLAELD